TLFWVSTAGAFLTKGPPGILFLLGIVPVYFLFRKTDRTTPPLFTPGGLLLFLLVGLGWYLYEAWQHPGLAGYWLGYETIGRLAGMEGEFHNPEWYAAFTVYGPILLLGPLPWIVPFISRLGKLKRERYSLTDLRKMFMAPQRLYLVLAFFVPLVIFSVSRSKLPLYMLPLFIPLSLFLGRSIYLMVSRGLIRSRSLVMLAILSAVFLVSLKGIAGLDIGQSSDMKWFHRAILEQTRVPLERQDLYLMHYKPLYGLEFYREGIVRRINYDHVSWKGGIGQDELSRQLEGTFQKGKIPLILVRDFNQKNLLPILPTGIYSDVSRLNEEWLLIRLERRSQ
ncbi:MAG TPA: hypothetical protein PLV56_07995, partial [Synergistales bacterium]|nr:hypothetical protein [Synergistales bacterium]